MPEHVVLTAPGQFWIGRDDVIDLRSADLRVSRRHAVIEVRDGRWWLLDRSSGGCFTLDGEQVTEVALTAKAAFRLGDAQSGPVLQLELQLEAESPPTPPRGLATEILSQLEDRVEIGRGGFAVVYRAFQPDFGRTVAVKVLDPGTDKAGLGRFDRERAAMGALSAHPNIVTVFDAGVTPEGLAYLLMEYMPDGSFDQRVDTSGPLPWVEVLDVGIKVAGALETAHGTNILHRDVKPANLLMSSYGEPCLSDFGLARLQGTHSSTGVTTTVLHAPPEVLDGKGSAATSDLYSLGSTLFTLLTGSAPFQNPSDETLLEVMARIATAPVPDLRGEGIPGALCDVLERALEKQPDRRYQTVIEMGSDLQRVQAEHHLPRTEMRLGPGASAAQSGPVTDALTRRISPLETPAPGASPPTAQRRRRRWRRR